MNLLSLLPIFTDWALLVARIIVATIFLAHGWPKIKNLKQNAVNFGAMGFKPGIFWGTLVAFTEVFGGLAILLGIGVPFAGLALIVDMIVATLWKLRKGMKLVNGYELDLVILAICLILAVAGPGVISL